MTSAVLDAFLGAVDPHSLTTRRFNIEILTRRLMLRTQDVAVSQDRLDDMKSAYDRVILMSDFGTAWERISVAQLAAVMAVYDLLTPPRRFDLISLASKVCKPGAWAKIGPLLSEGGAV